jgi:hypothetical protein
MRRWFVLLAACGGAPAPAKPAPPTDAAALVTGLEAYAERACGCADRACADALDEELTAWFAGGSVPSLHQPASPRVAAVMYRTVRCLWEHRTVTYAFEPMPIRVFESHADELCACPDFGCVEQVDTRDRRSIVRAASVPIRDGLDHPAIERAMQRRGACIEARR